MLVPGRLSSILFAVIGLAATAQSEQSSGHPSFLVLVADDVGVELVGAYGADDPARTPNIDRLAQRGVLFRNAWATPVCSPTRATILTGRYGYRTGVGMLITRRDGNELPLEETILPELLEGYRSFALGKWHLGRRLTHPLESGFDHHAGTIFNLDHHSGGNYSHWMKAVDGEQAWTRTYATTDTANETIAALGAGPGPRLVYTAFHAAHSPAHAPPAALHSYTLAGHPDIQQPLFVRAMVEALDTEIGRILEDLPPNTYVFFVGDNGTAPRSLGGTDESVDAKGSIAEAGIRVPLIVTGPGVAHGECTSLVNTTDLFATIAELAGLTSEAEDSVSLVPYFRDPKIASRREWAYAEKVGRIRHEQAVRGPRFKLVRSSRVGSVVERFYDLELDPGETRDLLATGLEDEQRLAYQRLALALPDAVTDGLRQHARRWRSR